MANTILLKGRGIRKEAVAAATITPGNLLTFNSSGLLLKHATEGGAVIPLFAVENDLLGKMISDDYAANDYVQAEYLSAGMEVLTWLAASENVAKGALLSSKGNGALRATTSGHVVVAQALEAVDNSAGGSAVRIKVVVF